MENFSKITVTDEEKQKYISALTPELIMLRTKAGISQEDLSVLIGVSRQTYGAIERRTRQMSWNTYLSLIMVFDYSGKTHDMLRATDAFPYEIIKRINADVNDQSTPALDELVDGNMRDIIKKLDDQAFRSIKTLIMLEYARCTDTPGDVVVKSFDGIDFSAPSSSEVRAENALKSIRKKRRKHV